MWGRDRRAKKLGTKFSFEIPDPHSGNEKTKKQRQMRSNSEEPSVRRHMTSHQQRAFSQNPTPSCPATAHRPTSPGHTTSPSHPTSPGHYTPGYHHPSHPAHAGHPLSPSHLPPSHPPGPGTAMDANRPSSLSVISSRHKSHSLGSLSDTVDSPVIDQEYISALTHDVRSFSDSLNLLKLVYGQEFENGEMMRSAAMERLGELLCILKSVLEKYPMLNSQDIFTAARTLINGVKNFDYQDEVSCDYNELYDGIDQLALAFSSSVSECLMGDVETSSPSSNRSRSFDSLSDRWNDGPGDLSHKDSLENLSPEDLDRVLMRLENGVDLSLQRAKAWSKYAKDMIAYVDKRCHLELEFAKNLSKLATAMKPIIRDENYLPFQSVYCTFMDHDCEYSNNCVATLSLIQGHKFIDPLIGRKSEHDKIRRAVKEIWAKACRKMQDSEVSLRKSKQSFYQRCQELEAAREAVDKAEESKVEKRRRTVDDCRMRLNEAEVAYRQAVNSANLMREDLDRLKSSVLTQLRDVISESEDVMKSLTVGYFQLYHKMAAPAPVQYQTLSESCMLYEPGSQFCEFVRHFHSDLPTEVHNVYVFEPYLRERSFDKKCSPPMESTSSESLSQKATKEKQLRSGHMTRGLQHVIGTSDTESGGSSRSHDSSPSASPNVVMRRRKIATIGEIEENAFDVDGGTGPFKNIAQSSAAKTHAFRKLRTPAKCRECDNYVYFNGAECAKCGLAIHKKCLEVCALCCGNKPPQRRLTTFGIDFKEQVECTRTDIPPIIVKCVAEIENRGMEQKGVYRVSGVKSRVEKLCQSFEIEGEKVDLTEHHPNVISNVLKLYLRQLPEPLLTFCLYGEFIKCAKEEGNTGREATVSRIASLVKLLPRANYKTLGYLIYHLKKVSEHEDENQMSACNLGIVFGPTLLRPKEGASLNSLVDTAFQTKIVEIMINTVQTIFGTYEAFSPRHKDTSSSLQPAATKVRRKSASMRETIKLTSELGGDIGDQSPVPAPTPERMSSASVGVVQEIKRKCAEDQKLLKRSNSDDVVTTERARIPLMAAEGGRLPAAKSKEKKKLCTTTSLDPHLIPPHTGGKPRKFGSWGQLSSTPPFTKLSLAFGFDDREPKYV